MRRPTGVAFECRGEKSRPVVSDQSKWLLIAKRCCCCCASEEKRDRKYNKKRKTTVRQRIERLYAETNGREETRESVARTTTIESTSNVEERTHSGEPFNSSFYYFLFRFFYRLIIISLSLSLQQFPRRQTQALFKICATSILFDHDVYRRS